MTNVSPLVAGLRCRCPRCGRGRLFKGFLTVAPRCDVCDLDLARSDSGDGPAVFIVLIVGALVTAMALIVEVKYQPPIWLHLALWFPLILLGTLGMLRPLKSVMIALQYRHRAGEDRNHTFNETE